MSTSDGLGALLARAREQRGLSQREVALRLNLAESTIHGLEGGDFHRLGAPIYVRSYLARYARLLGLPEEEVISRFRALDTSEPPPLRVVGSLKPQAPISDSGIRWFSYLVVFVLVGVLGWFGVAEMASRFDADDDALPAEPLAGPDGSLALPQPSPPKPATAVPTGPRNPADSSPAG
ncbi:MAG: helix-turn-helix domain-containing protein, partial [Pseudomonadota bacterium]|nr:helix-turn-helix domain-containing protein [Pseudomonadota bacterium]